MPREQFTVRIPGPLLDRVREQAAAYGDSMNDIVVAAIEKEVAMREQMRLFERIEEQRRRLAQRGVQPDSVSIVRQMRDEAVRHE